MSNQATSGAACVLGAGIFLWVALLSGCSASSEKSKPDVVDAVASPVTLSVTDEVGYEKALEAEKGKVVLVDYWATWCVPCRKKFPQTVALYEKYRDRGLAVLSVSLDSPESEQQVLDFLQENRATFSNLLSSYKSPSRATEAFDLPGPIPCYRVYGRDGVLQQEFTVDPAAEKQFTVEDIEAVVVELL